MRSWVVGGALILSDEGVLLVQNRRRNGSHDWSPPGGVIDDGETLLEGLTREVEEETGLRVTSWEGPVYEVRCEAPDLGWDLRVEAHLATAYEGELRVDDPDGIVVEAAFLPPAECALRCAAEGAVWVHEPLAEWLAERWGPEGARGYEYDVRGTRREDLEVRRAGE